MPAHYILAFSKMLLAFGLLLVYSNFINSGNLAPATTTDQIGDMVVGAIVGSTVLSTDVSIGESILSMILWLGLLYAVRLIKAKSPKIKDIIDGKSIKVIENHRFLTQNFKKSGMPIRSFLTQIHSQGYQNINDIDDAIISPSGEVIIKNDDDDENSIIIIENGVLNTKNLERIGKSEDWLMDNLTDKAVNDIQSVFIAEYLNDKLIIQK